MNEFPKGEQCGFCPIADWSDGLQAERQRLSESIYGNDRLVDNIMNDRVFREQLQNNTSFSPELVGEIKSVFSELAAIMTDNTLSEVEAYAATAVFAKRYNLRVNELAEVVAILGEDLRFQKMNQLTSQLDKIDRHLAMYDMSKIAPACVEGSNLRHLEKSSLIVLQCGSLAINEDQRLKMSILVHEDEDED